MSNPHELRVIHALRLKGFADTDVVAEAAEVGVSDTKAVLATLCETSTGALHDIEGLAAHMRNRDSLLVVDAVSALGADEIRMDAWGVDAVVACSQKGLMTPPGLAFVAFGVRATQAAVAARLPKYYFDLGKYQASQAKDTTPFTPAMSLMYGLQVAMRAIHEEGMGR